MRSLFIFLNNIDFYICGISGKNIYFVDGKNSMKVDKFPLRKNL